jgi:hypothetical protein
VRIHDIHPWFQTHCAAFCAPTELLDEKFGVDGSELIWNAIHAALDEDFGRRLDRLLIGI